MHKRLHRSIGELILKQFIEFWPYYLGAIIALFATHRIQSELPFLAKKLADSIVKQAQDVSVSEFLWLAIGIIVFRTSSRLLFFYPARVMQKMMRVELIEAIQKVTPLRYRKYPAGQLFQIVSSDMEQMRALIGFALMQIGNIVVALSVLAPRLIAFEKVFLLALTPMFLTFLLFTILVSRNRKYYAQTQQMQGKLNDIIIESYNGKKTIKNFHAENDFIELFDNFSFKELTSFYRAGVGVAISIPLVPFGVGASLLWGAHIVYQQQLGANALILFSGFVFLFLEPLMSLSWIGVVFSRSVESWKRIKKLVAELETPCDEEIYLDNLNEEASGNHFILPLWEKTIEVTLRPSQWLVLVGKTGSGKTHLLSNIAEILTRRNKSISFVAQDPYLYSDSIENNIFLGLEEEKRNLDLAYQLLELFGLTYLAQDRTTLMQLQVGENGKKLSGGQAKRLALVRGLMSGAEYLIWDDPFSSVDLILEKKIIDRLKENEILKDKNLILTSHRLLTVKQSDYVILIEKEMGIKESGDVNVLINQVESNVYEYFKSQMV